MGIRLETQIKKKSMTTSKDAETEEKHEMLDKRKATQLEEKIKFDGIN